MIGSVEALRICQGVLTSIHPATKEMNFWARGLVFASDEAISLVDTLCRVDRENLQYLLVHDSRPHRKRKLTQAQLTSPHSPPATTTASGCVGEVPRALAKTCFTLSYVTK